MKKITILLSCLSLAWLIACRAPQEKTVDFSAVSRIDSGKPFSVMLTAYSTTLIADGKAQTRLRIAIMDSLSREITSASDSVRLFVTGDGLLLNPDGTRPVMLTDTSGKSYAALNLDNGLCHMLFVAGTTPGKVKVEARCGKLWPGAHEIHTLPSTFVMMQPQPGQLEWKVKPTGRMIGADISWLPELEARGTKFYDSGGETDAIALLKRHGFNWIRLRIFVNPENDKGYSPGKGFCDLSHTLAMARRVQAHGMKLLLDFHYSDYWADPQQQYKPAAWDTLPLPVLADTVRAYTARVLMALKAQGTPPSMVQVGNEINHGILWPDGHIGNPDQLALLLKAGAEGVAEADPSIPVMIHLALGGQQEEAIFWLDNMIARGVTFDLLGISYYPRWHGTLEDLQTNLTGLVQRYHRPVNVVEYSDFKGPVHEIVFALPGGMGKGACIWEPLHRWSGLFDKENRATPMFAVYDSLAKRYLPASNQ